MTVAAGYEYEHQIEAPPVEPWSIALATFDSSALTSDVEAAALGLPLATERRDEYRVIVDVDTDRGCAEMPLPLRVEGSADNGSAGYRATGTQYGLTLAFLIKSKMGEIRWHLEPQGRDAAGRAAVLDLLIAMSGTGVLVLRDPEHGVLASLRVESQPLDESLYEERRFITDVLVIEAWSGRKLPVPAQVESEDGTAIAQLAHWIRHRRMRVRFTSNITGLTADPIHEANELRLHEHEDYKVFGVWIPLGRINYRVPVTIVGIKPEGDSWRVEFRPPTDWLTATITPPHGSASTRRVRAVDDGLVPRPRPPRATRRRDRAHRSAIELVEERRLDRPEDDEIRDEIRRRWPT